MPVDHAQSHSPARAGKGVLFVAPHRSSKGGIAAVVGNYAKSTFWNIRDCHHFGSCLDSGGKLSKGVYALGRYASFFFRLTLRRPRVVSVHTASRNSFYRKFFYILIARAFAVRVVLHIHPAYFHRFYSESGAITGAMVRWAGRQASKLVFLTPTLLEKFRPVFPDKPMTVIENPVDTELYRSARSQDRATSQTILFMGWIVEEKGVYDIVKAIPKVLAEFPDAEFRFAGNKEVEVLRQRIHDAGLDANAKVLGWVAGDAKLELFASARMLLLPSYTEGVPNVILEAMAAGLPVIATQVGGIPEVFEEGVNGLYVEPGNVDQLADAIIRLLRDEELTRRIAGATCAQAQQRFAVEKIGADLDAEYAEFF